MITRFATDAKRWSALLLCAAVLGHSPAAAMDLVKSGRPVATIVVPDVPLPAVTAAADELQYHLRKATGGSSKWSRECRPPARSEIVLAQAEPLPRAASSWAAPRRMPSASSSLANRCSSLVTTATARCSAFSRTTARASARCLAHTSSSSGGWACGGSGPASWAKSFLRPATSWWSSGTRWDGPPSSTPAGAMRGGYGRARGLVVGRDADQVPAR